MTDDAERDTQLLNSGHLLTSNAHLSRCHSNDQLSPINTCYGLPQPVVLVTCASTVSYTNNDISNNKTMIPNRVT